MITELIVAATLLGYTPLSVPNHEVHSDHIVILDTIGGSVMPFADQFVKWEAENKALKIKGICGSACTMALANPWVCAMPKAIFGFHQARRYNPVTGELGEPSEGSNRLLWAHYSVKVKAIVKELTPEMRYFKGTDLIPPC